MKRKPIVSVSTIVVLVGIGAIGFMVLWGMFGGNKLVVENIIYEAEVKATSTEPELPAEWLEEAEKAKADVLRRKALEKENSDLDAQIKTLETRQAEIEKELGF